MIRSNHNPVGRMALGAGLLLVVAGCARQPREETPLIDGVSQAVGFDLPADAAILAYHHQHDGDGDDEVCSQLWIIRASSALAGPDRRTKQQRAKSPFSSLKLLVEQVTDGRVVIDAAEPAACECVEWQRGETICRLRQAKTPDGWVAAMEAISSH